MSEIYINRERAEYRLKRRVFSPRDSYGDCVSLVGPNGVGKTTLIRHLADEFQKEGRPHEYYFATSMEMDVSFWSYWKMLIIRFSKTITEEELMSAPNPNEKAVEIILKTYEFFNDMSINEVGNEQYNTRATGYLNELFTHYTGLGIRIIITIDEFDRARTIFPDGDGRFFQRLFGLTVKGAARLNLSIVTISRRSVSTIAHDMQQGSNFEDAYPAETLRGFNNQELEEYFKLYETLPLGCLSESEKQEVMCLCGRHPGMLMEMFNQIDLLRDEKISINGIYREHGSFVDNTFNHMTKVMKDEFVDIDRRISSLDVFVQKFIGPVYSDNLSDLVKRLFHYGMVTECGQEEKNIFDLAGLKEYRDKGHLSFEPISPYYVEFIKDKTEPESLHALAKILEQTERHVRRVISSALSQSYPDTWQDVISADIPTKDDYLLQLRKLAAENNAEERELAFSKLNVLAFNDYSKIIGMHWDIMKSYFTSYASIDELVDDFKILNKCRNTSAHLNLEIINGETRKTLKSICEKILSKNDKASSSAAENMSKNNLRQTQVGTLGVGQLVNVTRLTKTKKGGLTGYSEVSNVRISISKSNLLAAGKIAGQLLGRRVSVKIIRWDENAQTYNAEIVR